MFYYFPINKTSTIISVLSQKNGKFQNRESYRQNQTKYFIDF